MLPLHAELKSTSSNLIQFVKSVLTHETWIRIPFGNDSYLTFLIRLIWFSIGLYKSAVECPIPNCMFLSYVLQATNWGYEIGKAVKKKNRLWIIFLGITYNPSNLMGIWNRANWNTLVYNLLRNKVFIQ